MSHKMSREEFIRHLDEGAPTSAKDVVRMNWEGAFADAEKQGVPLTAREFYDDHVKGKVGFSYCKKKLNDRFDKKQVVRILDGNTYFYFFDSEVVANYHSK